MARTAFVTGATGFLGLNLVEVLLAQGWRVIALHRSDSDLKYLRRLPAVRLVTGDTTCDGSKAMRELGYCARPLSEMVTDCARWLAREGLLPGMPPGRPADL